MFIPSFRMNGNKKSHCRSFKTAMGRNLLSRGTTHFRVFSLLKSTRARQGLSASAPSNGGLFRIHLIAESPQRSADLLGRELRLIFLRMQALNSSARTPCTTSDRYSSPSAHLYY